MSATNWSGVNGGRVGSADGTLVYTLPDRLCLKDLYKIGSNWDEDVKQVNGPQGMALYAGATQPGQLIIAEGRILAVADSGGTSGMPPNQISVGKVRR